MTSSELVSKALENLAREAAKAWDFDIAVLTLHSQSENTVFRIETMNNEVYALRLHRAGYHDLASLESENAWTSALASAGLSVPEAVLTRDGEAYVNVAMPDSGESRYVGLVKWIAGTTLSEVLKQGGGTTEISKVYEALGGIIADFHLASVGWSAPPGFKRHSWDAQGLMGNEPFWGRFWEVRAATASEQAELLEARDQILQTLVMLPRDAEVFTMIHADLNANNVLRDGDKLKVIDFDDAGFGWHAFDLAVAIWNRMDAFHRHGHFKIAYDGLLNGYKNRRPDSDHVLAQVPLFLVVRSLILLRWMQDRPEAGYASFIPKLIQLVLAQVRELDYS